MHMEDNTTSCAPAPVHEAVESGHQNPEVSSAIPKEELNRMTDDMIAAIKTVYDPEIPVDIFELGLIYKIDVEDDRSVKIDMTLTAPGCPVAGEMPGWVADAVRTVEGVMDVDVQLTFEPPWDPSRMSDEARVALNMW
jgi:FeS assembly SUF system protein